MNPKRPVIVIDLFPEERSRLLDLLLGLTPDQWQAETSCPGWSVKDIAAHVLGDDLNNLSGGRDGYRDAWFEAAGWDDLVAFINRRNEAWVEAMRRLSPQVLIELLEIVGERHHKYFRTLDPLAPGPNVAWAGSGPMPSWLHIAREYTERWLHQAQVRDALGAPLLYERRLFFPVLDAFVHALPIAYAGVDAPTGTHVVFEATGDAGGRWSLVRFDGRWQLMEGVEAPPAATVSLPGDVAWRLWTRALTPEEVQDGAVITGQRELGMPALRAVAIIA
jgi:uncharacterized protein (TIGR03083 family)